MQTAGAKLLSAIAGQGIDDYLNLGVHKDWFIGADEELFDFFFSYMNEYGVLPTQEAIGGELGIALPTTLEPPDYYANKLELRFLQATAKRGMLDAQKMLKMKNPKKALDILEQAVSDARKAEYRNDLINFASEDALNILHADYVQKNLQGDAYGVPTGYEYLDKQGLMVGGDVLALAARGGRGKTYLLLKMALASWSLGNATIFFSMEMKAIAIMQRLIAMLQKFSVSQYKKGALATKTYNSKVKGLSFEGRPPFWVVDGNLTASVEDVEMLTKQLKPQSIYVDGAYMLETVNKGGYKTMTWEKVKYTIEGLKKNVATKQNIPVFTTYQFTKEQTKFKKSGGIGSEIEHTGLEHIGGGDVIGHVASVVLALFQENTTDALIKKTLSVLKGRDGEVGSFDINWIFDNYPYMDFTEIHEATPKDLQFN